MSFSDEILKYKEDNGRVIEKVIYNSSELFRNKYSRFPKIKQDERFQGNLIPGKIYIFDYKQEIGSKKKPYLNPMPIALYCGSGEKLDVGVRVEFFIDLVVTPPNYRVDILSKIMDKYSEALIKNSKNMNTTPIPIDLRYKSLRNILVGTGFESSYVGFKTTSIKNIRVIDLSDWKIIPYLNINGLDTNSIKEIYNRYNTKLNENKGI